MDDRKQPYGSTASPPRVDTSDHCFAGRPRTDSFDIAAPVSVTAVDLGSAVSLATSTSRRSACQSKFEIIVFCVESRMLQVGAIPEKSDRGEHVSIAASMLLGPLNEHLCVSTSGMLADGRCRHRIGTGRPRVSQPRAHNGTTADRPRVGSGSTMDQHGSTVAGRPGRPAVYFGSIPGRPRAVPVDLLLTPGRRHSTRHRAGIDHRETGSTRGRHRALAGRPGPTWIDLGSTAGRPARPRIDIRLTESQAGSSQGRPQIVTGQVPLP